MFGFNESLLLDGIKNHPLVVNVVEVHPKRLSEPWAKDRSVCRGVQLQVSVNGVATEICFGIDRSFPLSLPVLSLHPWDRFGVIPHVDNDGFICYAQQEGILIDTKNVTGLAHEAITRAVKVLEEGISGANHNDFLDEFGAYWGWQEKAKSATSLVSPDHSFKTVSLYKHEEKISKKGKKKHRSNKVRWYLSDDIDTFNSFFQSQAAPKTSKALYIPLQPGGVIIPPHPSAFWCLDDIRRIIRQNVSPAQKADLDALTALPPSAEEVVVLCLPRPSGGETLLGISFSGVKGAHPLHQGGAVSTVARIDPVLITRRDREYLLPRGGSSLSLRDKKILLLGCGALGGYIAAELTRAGIIQLTVLDKDLLTAENYFRHFLGRKYINQPKAVAIKKEIESRLPYVKVSALFTSLEEAIQNNLIDLNSFDLIISALGNPTVELAFDKMVRSTLSDIPPRLYSWLEPYGIGGHAVLTGTKGGCFKCLYSPSEDGDLHCRAAFAEKGQVFAKNISGCRNVFTPFGSLDALKTAELTVRAAIDALKGTISAPLLRSWKGDASEFEEKGFILASRYHQGTLELKDYRLENCPVCQETFLGKQ